MHTVVLTAVVAAALPVQAPIPAARYQWPVDGPPPVVRRFAPPPKPWLPGHRGVDLGAAPEVVVRAAGPGTVVFAGTVVDRGVVSIDHAGGLRTTYEPVAPTVTAGQSVRAGDPIGTLTAGHDGCPVAACLHWGLRRGDVYLDPLALVGAGRVRLLPLQQGRQPLGQPVELVGPVVDLRRHPQVAATVVGADVDLGTRLVGDPVA